jgi:hypothetical protein
MPRRNQEADGIPFRLPSVLATKSLTLFLTSCRNALRKALVTRHKKNQEAGQFRQPHSMKFQKCSNSTLMIESFELVACHRLDEQQNRGEA